MRSTMQDAELLVSELLAHGERVHPEAAVRHYSEAGTVTSTFAEVSAQARRLAGALRSLGVEPDDVVATLCWNTPAHLAAYFAVPSIGAVLHTLNLRLSDEQLVYIVNHAGDRVVIVDEDLTPQLARILPQCPTIRDVVVVGSSAGALQLLAGPAVHDHDDLLAAAEPVEEWPRLDERSAAVLCYTTGTTGDPKGVAYSHRSIYLHTLGISTGSAFAFSDADRVLPIVPMFHANAWGWPYAAWISGAELVMPDRYLQPEQEWVRFSTRTGRIVPGVRARVVDEAGAELPWDGAAAGEVELRGPTITGSYFRVTSAAAADKFRDGWLRTGDLGVIHPSGWVELKDRLKDGIKSGGEWISSVELENALAGHPAVAEVAVIGVPDPRWEERPLVCVKLREGATAAPEELREYLTGRVARWWLPERWTFVDEIPKTSVGKLDKKRMRADYGQARYAVQQVEATPSRS